MFNPANHVLDDSEIDCVSGAGTCMYNGKEYSVGAVIYIGGGLGQRCIQDGPGLNPRWSATFPMKFDDTQKYL